MRPGILLRGEIINFNRPKVMGILNVTPDSFYAGSRQWDKRGYSAISEQISVRVDEMISQGVDWIDIGGYSTRPGYADVAEKEELDRLKAGMEGIRRVSLEIPVSVDTFRSKAARVCVEEYSADIINDISGGTGDEEMWETVSDLKVPYILTHSITAESSFHTVSNYSDVVAEVLQSLAFRLAKLRDMGMADVIIDPGFGFSKSVEENFKLLSDLKIFRTLNAPILAGISRKSMIWKALGVTPEESLTGTTVLNTAALLNGADIIRVHDIREGVECVELIQKIKNQNHDN